MKRAWALIKGAGAWLYNALGDPRSKNALLVLLALMTAFGVVAPEVATSIRDSLIALAF
jgi:hypothetical protein